MRRRYARSRWRGRRGEPVPLLLAPDERWTLLDALVLVCRVVRRWRSELAPLFVLAGTFAVGAWLHAAHPGWWPAPAMVGVLAAVVVLWGPARWLGSWDRRPERVYLTVLAVTTGGWLSAATALGPTHDPLPGIALVAGLVLAVPWWADRRRRAATRVDRKLERWPEIAELAGIKGVQVQSKTVHRWGWTARLALRGAVTVRKVAEAADTLESQLDTRRGAIRVEPDPNRASRATLRVIEHDPHAQPIPWPRPPDRRSIKTPIELGLFEDAQPVRVELAGRHVLIGGATGAGKSGLLNVILAALTGCPDVRLWGIDLKGGMELRPWAGRLHQLAVTGEQATTLLGAAVAELDHRAAQLAERGLRAWHPSPAEPALVIVVDEYAELPDPARPLADSIARRGRAVAITLLVATQRPTQQAMGHGAVRSQMDVRICLRVREQRDADLILGQGMVTAGWRAHQLDAEGKFLIASKHHSSPRRARAYLLTDRQVAEIATRHARHTATDHVTPDMPTPRASPDHGEQSQPAPVPPSADPRREVIDPHRALLAALRDAPPDGATIAELIAACGMRRSWVYAQLRQHAHAGRANQVSRGRWRANNHTP